MTLNANFALKVLDFDFTQAVPGQSDGKFQRWPNLQKPFSEKTRKSIQEPHPIPIKSGVHSFSFPGN